MHIVPIERQSWQIWSWVGYIRGLGWVTICKLVGIIGSRIYKSFMGWIELGDV